MRRLGTLILFVGLTAPAYAGTGEDSTRDEPSIPWYRWLFLGERAKPAQATKPQRTQAPPAGTATRDRVPPASTSKESMAKTLANEQAAYVERLLAISKIRKIAVDQNDEAMLKRADELELQAEEVYKQRTARLTAGGLDDRAALERGRDDRPATADKTPPRRRTTGGMDR